MILDYDTIILDLDDTVWHGSEKNIWAKTLRGQITLQNVNDQKRVYDETGRYLYLDKDIVVFLNKLKNDFKRIEFISRGMLPCISFDKQPSIIALKYFDIFHLFDKRTLLYKNENKGHHIISTGKTIFIDDNDIDVNRVQKLHKNITCINRNIFDNWMHLYER